MGCRMQACLRFSINIMATNNRLTNLSSAGAQRVGKDHLLRAVHAQPVGAGFG